MHKIYAIPGLGTTKELFRELKITGVEVVVLDWPAPSKNETLKSYAERFIEKIDTREPFYLMGVSFGGMLCVELNDILKPQKTFLISSSKFRNELPPAIRIVKTLPLHLMFSESFLRFINKNSRHIIGFEKNYLPEFISMMNCMSSNYYKYSIDRIVNWDRKHLGQNIIHLHGNADKLLPHQYVKADHIIEGGTHAMVVYKADEISAIINTLL